MVVLVMENSLHSFQQATLFLQGNWCPVYRDTPGRGFVKLPAMSGVLLSGGERETRAPSPQHELRSSWFYKGHQDLPMQAVRIELLTGRCSLTSGGTEVSGIRDFWTWEELWDWHILHVALH